MSAPTIQEMARDQVESNKSSSDRGKMASDKLPLVTALLRACRDGNELLIKQALRDVIVNGITPEELNATDKSGRTAISYICSNGLLQFLDIILQIPKIDVNKPDNEGNTPLHFAAEAGRLEILNMLISRCRTLEINKKNHLGFTPLMKAAVQGRSRCAKILLMGGASALETDAKRNMRADQLADMCNHTACRDMIVNCAKAVMEKNGGSFKWPSDNNTYIKKVVARSNTGTLMSANSLNTSNTNGSTGIRSKLRKVFPFGLALKDKSASNNITKNKRSETSDLVSYLSAAALCASTEPALAKDQTKFIKNLIHHHDVPKLEVTYANNNTLIKKMENSRFTEAEQHRDKSPVMVRIK